MYMYILLLNRDAKKKKRGSDGMEIDLNKGNTTQKTMNSCQILKISHSINNRTISF